MRAAALACGAASICDVVETPGASSVTAVAGAAAAAGGAAGTAGVSVGTLFVTTPFVSAVVASWASAAAWAFATAAAGTCASEFNVADGVAASVGAGAVPEGAVPPVEGELAAVAGLAGEAAAGTVGFGRATAGAFGGGGGGSARKVCHA